MKLRTTILAICDYASTSKEGKVSINGIFDEIYVQKFPGGLARAFLVATFIGEPNTTYSLKINLESKAGKVLNTNNVVTTTSANSRNNLIVELNGLGFEKEGDYKFVIYDGAREVGSTELKVMNVGDRQQQATFKLPN
ncbi:MAG TPA: hypothetical protein VLF20_01105 [Patescibacteria group bacterium]|nr:hypothetical protein [Patescibacteria group bacterium]